MCVCVEVWTPFVFFSAKVLRKCGNVLRVSITMEASQTLLLIHLKAKRILQLGHLFSQIIPGIAIEAKQKIISYKMQVT